MHSGNASVYLAVIMDVHHLQTRNRKLNVRRRLTEQRKEEEGKRDICLQQFPIKRQ